MHAEFTLPPALPPSLLPAFLPLAVSLSLLLQEERILSSCQFLSIPKLLHAFYMHEQLCYL